MAYASQAGRARTNPKAPQAHAICDRCGFRYNFVDLQWQFDWRGASLQNLRILVCDRCHDTPQEQLRAITLPPDPEPIINARPEPYAQDSSDFMRLNGGTIDPITGIPIPSTIIMSLDGVTPMVAQPIGSSGALRSNYGLTPDAQMPLVSGVKWHQPIPFSSIQADGTQVVTVTCSQPHGLLSNAQIAVLGASNLNANGFFFIYVTTLTAFVYSVFKNIPAGSLIAPHTEMVTVNAGWPYGFPPPPIPPPVIPPIPPIPPPPVGVLLWTALMALYPGLLTLNGYFVMASSGFPVSDPSLPPGTPCSNGGFLLVTAGSSSGSPAWITGLATTPTGTVPGQVYLDGLFVVVAP